MGEVFILIIFPNLISSVHLWLLTSCCSFFWSSIVFLFPVVSFLVSLRFCSPFLLSLQQKSWMIILIKSFFYYLGSKKKTNKTKTHNPQQHWNKASLSNLNLCEYQVCLESSSFLFWVIGNKNLIKAVSISVVHHATWFWELQLCWILLGNNCIFANRMMSAERWTRADGAALAWGILSKACLSVIINRMSSQDCL